MRSWRNGEIAYVYLRGVQNRVQLTVSFGILNLKFAIHGDRKFNIQYGTVHFNQFGDGGTGQ
jgi:hypothetical protein